MPDHLLRFLCLFSVICCIITRFNLQQTNDSSSGENSKTFDISVNNKRNPYVLFRDFHYSFHDERKFKAKPGKDTKSSKPRLSVLTSDVRSSNFATEHHTPTKEHHTPTKKHLTPTKEHLDTTKEYIVLTKDHHTPTKKHTTPNKEVIKTSLNLKYGHALLSNAHNKRIGASSLPKEATNVMALLKRYNTQIISYEFGYIQNQMIKTSEVGLSVIGTLSWMERLYLIGQQSLIQTISSDPVVHPEFLSFDKPIYLKTKYRQKRSDTPMEVSRRVKEELLESPTNAEKQSPKTGLCYKKCFNVATNKNCSCDLLCFSRGDCCHDVDLFCPMVSKYALSLLYTDVLQNYAVCDPEVSVFVITSCPVESELIASPQSVIERYFTYLTDVDTGLVYKNISIFKCHVPDGYKRAIFWKLIVELSDGVKVNDLDQLLHAARQNDTKYIPPYPYLRGVVRATQLRSTSPFASTVSLNQKMDVVDVSRTGVPSGWRTMSCNIKGNKICKITSCNDMDAKATISKGKCQYDTKLVWSITHPSKMHLEEDSLFCKDPSSDNCQINIKDIASSLTCLLRDKDGIVDAQILNMNINYASTPLLDFYGRVVSAQRTFSMYTITWKLTYAGVLNIREIQETTDHYLAGLLGSYNITSADRNKNMYYNLIDNNDPSKKPNGTNVYGEQCKFVDTKSVKYLLSEDLKNCIYVCIQAEFLIYGSEGDPFCSYNFHNLMSYDFVNQAKQCHEHDITKNSARRIENQHAHERLVFIMLLLLVNGSSSDAHFFTD